MPFPGPKDLFLTARFLGFSGSFSSRVVWAVNFPRFLIYFFTEGYLPPNGFPFFQRAFQTRGFTRGRKKTPMGCDSTPGVFKRGYKVFPVFQGDVLRAKGGKSLPVFVIRLISGFFFVPPRFLGPKYSWNPFIPGEVSLKFLETAFCFPTVFNGF